MIWCLGYKVAIPRTKNFQVFGCNISCNSDANLPIVLMKYKDRTKVMLPNLLLRKYSYNYNEIFIYRVYILHKIVIIFPLLLH